MKMNKGLSALLCVLVGSCGTAATANDVITFDSLSNQPAQNNFRFLNAANGNSSVLDGVTFDALFVVTGNHYVEAFQNSGGPDPFANTHSGNYALFNASGTDGLKLTTAKILYGAWFGRVDYGNGAAGATQVTVEAFNGNTLLGGVSKNLTSTTLTYLDTSIFATYSGITDYKILRVASGVGSYGGTHYIVDDMQFSPATTPEPGAIGLIAAAATTGACFTSRRRRKLR